MNPIEPPSGRVHDRQGMRNAVTDLQKAVGALEAADLSLEYEIEGRAAFHMLRGAIKAGQAGMETLRSILRTAIHRDNISAAAEFTEQHSGEDLDQIERELGIAGKFHQSEFIGHLKIVVELADANRLDDQDVANEAALSEQAGNQLDAVLFIQDYLEAHSDESA